MSAAVMTTEAAGSATPPVAVDTGGDDTLWREAVRWLVDLDMLPKDHIVTAPDAGVSEPIYVLYLLCIFALEPHNRSLKSHSFRTTIKFLIVSVSIEICWANGLLLSDRLEVAGIRIFRCSPFRPHQTRRTAN